MKDFIESEKEREKKRKLEEMSESTSTRSNDEAIFLHRNNRRNHKIR